MSKNINPFVVSGKIPEEYFCDRVAEAAALEKALTNQLNVVLTSTRRMGKTSLVDFVFDKSTIADRYVTVFVDILSTTTFREFVMAFGTAVFDRVASRSDKLRRLFATLLKSLSASFGYDPVQNTPTFDIRIGVIHQPEYTLSEIFEYLEKVESRCLVVIDEFQQITRYPEKNVEALLRTHIQKLSNVNFVFSGSRRRLMEEIFFSSKRPFCQSAKALRLEAIDKEVYFAFAQKNFNNSGKYIDKEAFDKIYDTFWGVTFYVQRILKEAYADVSVGETCDVALTEKLIDDYVGENGTNIREELSHLTEVQKQVLYAVHKEQLAKNIASAAFNRKHSLRSPSSTQTAVAKLLEYGFITRNENVYSLSDPLLNLWLNRRR